MTTLEMILRPMDFSILDILTDGRNVAGNIYIELDSAKPYVNERMTHLHDYGLVRRIGPNENVGLYELTEKGERALKHSDLYKQDEALFEKVVEGDVDPEEVG